MLIAMIAKIEKKRQENLSVQPVVKLELHDCRLSFKTKTRLEVARKTRF